MKTINKVVSVFVAAGALMAPSLASAQETTVRLEPGLAVPVGNPQTTHFNVGVDGMVKLDLPVTSFFDVVPGVGVLALTQSSDFSKTGTAWLAGGGVRLHRSHNNSGHGLTAASPWVDGDVQYVRTGELNRFGWSVGAGVAAPLTESRVAWLGPFVRYQSVFSPSQAGFDTTDAKVMVVGLSLELGPKRKVAPTPMLPPPAVLPPVVVVPPLTVAPPAEVESALKVVVQFKVDSSVLDATAKELLDGVADRVLSARRTSDIQVEGHASSDGPLAHNKVLAQHRAEAVKAYLVSKGVAASRLTAQGFGISKPVQSNKTLKGREKNRRTEVVVSTIVTVKAGS